MVKKIDNNSEDITSTINVICAKIKCCSILKFIDMTASCRHYILNSEVSNDQG
jgi:hypothetical protein